MLRNIFGPLSSPMTRSRVNHAEGFLVAPPTVADNSQGSIKGTISKEKLTALYILSAFGFLILIGRLMGLQFFDGDSLRAIAESNRIRLAPILADRAEIYDRTGLELATNIPSFRLLAVPADLSQDQITKDHMSSLVQEITGKTVHFPTLEAAKGLKKYESIPLIEDIPYEQALRLRVALIDFDGISVDLSSTRQYPQGQAFAHLIGYVAHPSENDLPSQKNNSKKSYALYGKTGLEEIYDAALRGIDGVNEFEVDARGRQKSILTTTSAEPGSPLTLTIDGGLQNSLYESLMRAINLNHGTGGAAVVMDVDTGELRAIVSAPSYDPNALVHGLSNEAASHLFGDPNHPLFFRSISGEYPSGSIIKPVVAAGALSDGIITPSTTVLSTGGIRVGQWFFPDWKEGGHGKTDLVKAIAESVNTFFYAIGGGYGEIKGLGEQRLAYYAHLFGLGELTGIDLSGEKDGLIPTPKWKLNRKNEPWYIGDTYHFAIGQGDVLVTPIQMVRMIAVFANGGTLVKPHLIINSPSMEHLEVPVNGSALSSVRKGLREAVVTGSARGLMNLPVEVAGKTGTAQAASGNPHAWFLGYAPYNEPRFAIVVLVEHGGEGSTAAIPVARDALQFLAHEGFK